MIHYTLYKSYKENKETGQRYLSICFTFVCQLFLVSSFIPPSGHVAPEATTFPGGIEVLYENSLICPPLVLLSLKQNHLSHPNFHSRSKFVHTTIYKFNKYTPCINSISNQNQVLLMHFIKQIMCISPIIKFNL